MGYRMAGTISSLTLCEVSPGVICAGGYASGLYRIEKKTGRVEYFPPSFAAEGRPDQYINDIGKDSGGCIWTGAATISNVSIPMTAQYACTRSRAPSPPYWRRLRNGCGSVPAWGCTCLTGTGDLQTYRLSSRGGSCLCTVPGTGRAPVYRHRRAGLLVYDSVEDRFVRQYQTENCALISNNIHTIVPVRTAPCYWGPKTAWPCSGVSGTFRNWTAEQGLASVCLNAGVSTFRHGESFVFGSNTGAVMFPPT